MKANEAPEKIYVDNPNHDFWYRTKNSNSIEYTSTDAFIEKACAYLDSIGHRYIIDAFRNYMKGE